GGVLRRAAGPHHGPGALRAQRGAGRGRGRRRARAPAGAGDAGVPGHRAEAGHHALPAPRPTAGDARERDRPRRRGSARVVCGIAGIARRDGPAPTPEALRRMAAALHHRGPDGHGLFVGRRVGLAHTRLSIIDLQGGAQPLTNEDGSVVVVYNGEIYNYVELQAELERAGHRFRTRCDTEVLVHGWEEWGTGLFERLNGQFAFAIYDRRSNELILARDRFGIRPLFYSARDGRLVFGSEVKALFASREVD